MTPDRWSGYATQSEAWQRGYEWAYSRGEHAGKGCIEASEAYGYDFTSTDGTQFSFGAKFAQVEQGERLV